MGDRIMYEELKIAENINTPAERLRELSKTKEREILAAIAKNPNTPPDLLVELAGEYLDERLSRNKRRNRIRNKTVRLDRRKSQKMFTIKIRSNRNIRS